MKTFDVSVTRIGYGHRVIQVQAETPGEAMHFAEQVAGNYEFSENQSDYVADGATPVASSFVADLNRALHAL